MGFEVKRSIYRCARMLMNPAECCGMRCREGLGAKNLGLVRYIVRMPAAGLISCGSERS